MVKFDSVDCFFCSTLTERLTPTEILMNDDALCTVNLCKECREEYTSYLGVYKELHPDDYERRLSNCRDRDDIDPDGVPKHIVKLFKDTEHRATEKLKPKKEQEAHNLEEYYKLFKDRSSLE